ncbi:homogentisate 1-2-dioxygenase [Apiospora rasikravindrae]|uniref:homogentisate 1,2-dioxygenase n=1 Tax=Apiospora rasikravindrae TaxID=990691 RepID=A0ABR1SDB9_9PEZI
MAPMTKFAVEDPYQYLEGLGNYHSSEALQGAIPQVNNTPQRPPLGLHTERISGSAFTSPRDQYQQTFLYRAQSSMLHSDFAPLEVTSGYGPQTSAVPAQINPNSYFWPSFPIPEQAHWITGQALLGSNGDPVKKEGTAIWVFSVTMDMPARHVFSSLDGEMLIIPQSGALDIQTELGFLMVRQNEIAVIPRGVRYRITLPDGKPCRGFVCELFQGHFRLPDLGIVGTTGLANVRDFQVPTAFFDGSLVEGVAKANSREGDEWTIVSRLAGKLWHCTQTHTPFDVAGWHGTSYPYKLDLGRFCPLGNTLFDEHDPSLYTVLSARHHGAEPGTAVLDFVIVPPRWNVSEDTLWLPYYHRNTMQEFFSAIVSNQDPAFPFNNTNQFAPFGAGLHGAMSTHGASDAEMRAARELDTSRPRKLQTDGFTPFVLETERPLELSEWAYGCAQKNPQAKGRLAKM